MKWKARALNKSFYSFTGELGEWSLELEDGRWQLRLAKEGSFFVRIAAGPKSFCKNVAKEMELKAAILKNLQGAAIRELKAEEGK